VKQLTSDDPCEIRIIRFLVRPFIAKYTRKIW